MPFANSWGIEAQERSKSRLEYFRKYAKEHPYLKRDSLRALRKEILTLNENKCKKCGYNDDERALQIDHISGGGSRERQKHGSGFYQRVIKSMKNKENKYQILCANCNFIKRYENNEMGGVKNIL